MKKTNLLKKIAITSAILTTLFISIFALDVFSEGYNFLGIILALWIHLIPTYILISALLVACKWERFGGILFIILGLFYIYMFWSRTQLLSYIIISGPLIPIGILFILSSLKKKEPSKKKKKR